MTDVLIVQQFEILIINIFGMHIGFIILQVSTIMEVPLAGSQIGPCLKCVLCLFHHVIPTLLMLLLLIQHFKICTTLRARNLEFDRSYSRSNGKVILLLLVPKRLVTQLFLPAQWLVRGILRLSILFINGSSLILALLLLLLE